MIEFHPQEIRLPEELRAPLLRRPGGVEPSKIAEEAWTPEQTHLADILKNAFKGEDSLDSNVRQEAVSKPIGELTLPEGVKIDANDRTISYKGHQFGLPPALQINPETKTITYTPRTFGATPAVLAGVEKNTAPTKNRVGYKADPIFQAKAKPVTPAEQAQQAAAARAAQAQQAAAAQKADVAKEAAIVAKKKPSGLGTKRSQGNSEETNPPIKRFKSETASDIIEAQESMSQAIAGARTTQQTKTAKREETSTAVERSAQQNVGNVVAAKSASEDANQQNQQGRREAEYQKQVEQEATSVGAAKPGQGAPGKSKK